MSIFKKSDGSEIETKGEYQAGGGFIPDGTECQAYITEIEWRTPPVHAMMKDEHIYVEWSIASGEYKNRKLFQSLRIKSDIVKDHDKGMMILATLYKIAGKDITKITEIPDDAALSKTLQNLKASIKVGFIKAKEEGDKDRNFIQPIKSTKVPADKDEDDDIPL